jgi:hypothetical protein
VAIEERAVRVEGLRQGPWIAMAGVVERRGGQSQEANMVETTGAKTIDNCSYLAATGYDARL